MNGRDDWSSIADSLSTNALKLYSPVMGQYYGDTLKENKNVKKRKLVLKNQCELSHARFITCVS